MLKHNPKIEELAELLAKNHVNISLSNRISKDHKEIYDNIFGENVSPIEGKYRPVRCIVVVGAGADNNACNKLKLGKEVAQELKVELTKGKPALRELVNKELERLKRIYKLNSDEFETVLFALNKYFSSELLKKLRERYTHSHNPCFTYEVLAHLMKHRFIDAIINFNFSELLDQSIKDELKEDEYHKIVFDGDVDYSTFKQDENGELRLPLYIKPHGTISHPSTLRFTDEAYYGLPSDIENALRQLIKATWTRPGTKKSERMKVVLIVMGFNMQSFEFNVILNENLTSNSQVFFVNGEKGVEAPHIDCSYLNMKARKAEKKKVFFKKTPKVIAAYHDEFMKALWWSIENKFDKNFRPRGIKRHELIARLFNNKDSLRSIDETPQYFWQRAYLEFALSIAKYKGFITTEQIEHDRFGRYFHRALKSEENKNDKTYPKNLIEFIEELQLNSVGYGSAKAFSLSTEISESIAMGKPLTINEAKFRSHPFYESIIRKLEPTFSKKRDKEEVESLLRETFSYLFNAGDTEISAKYDNIYGHIFSNPRVIKSQLEFRYLTLEYMKDQSLWDELHVVAETGAWVEEKLQRAGLLDAVGTDKKKVILIYADLTPSKKIENLRLMYPNTIHWVPWWEHNQHLTLFVKTNAVKKEDNGIKKAFYYTRRLRSSLINPVEITEDGDINILKEIFAAYLIKAVTDPQIIDRGAVQDKIRELYGDWAKANPLQ